MWEANSFKKDAGLLIASLYLMDLSDISNCHPEKYAFQFLFCVLRYQDFIFTFISLYLFCIICILFPPILSLDSAKSVSSMSIFHFFERVFAKAVQKTEFLRKRGDTEAGRW
jgi:hypothetical protein